jgi:hypothetical protein
MDFREVCYWKPVWKSVDKIQVRLKSDKLRNTVHEILIGGRNIQTNVVEKTRTDLYPHIYGFRKSAVHKVIKKNTKMTDRPYMTYTPKLAQKKYTNCIPRN